MLHQLLTSLLALASGAYGIAYIAPGAVWYDTDGVKIDAHGGMVFQRESTFFWIGYAAENQTPMMYSSSDLMNWENLGSVAPSVTALWRPKYAKPNGSFWIYGQFNRTAESLVSSSLTSGYHEVEAVYLPPDDYSYSDTGMFLDQDLDTYFLLTSADHNVVQINQIDSDGSVGARAGYLAEGAYEAPGMVKVDGYYYLIVSSKTGYRANPNVVWYASELGSSWSGGTYIAPEAENTYGSQNTFELTISGTETTTYIYMGDAWDSTGSAASNYVWLPMSIDTSAHTITLDYYSAWTIDTHTGIVSAASTKKRYHAAEHGIMSGNAVVRECSTCTSKRAVHGVDIKSEVAFHNVTGTGDIEYVTFHYTVNEHKGDVHVFLNDQESPMVLSELNFRAGKHSSTPIPMKLNLGDTNTIRIGATGAAEFEAFIDGIELYL